MRTATIQTGPNKFRTVYITHGRERRQLGRLADTLAITERRLATAAGVESVAHGFVTGRSPVTMAAAHVGYDVTVSLDLADWFENVSVTQLLYAGLPTTQAFRCVVGGVVRQGLPTSPAAANIAAVAMDQNIWAALQCGSMPVVYTRYADDLTISWRAGYPVWSVENVIGRVRTWVEHQGWTINARKTRIQYADAGRRIICGLSVGPDDVRATRHVRRRLRAGQHSSPGTPQVRGLAEWAACKMPVSGRSREGQSRVITGKD